MLYPQSRLHPSSNTLVTSLPTELLVAIAGHLPWRDVLSLRKTCRIFRQISWDRAVWRNVYVTWASTCGRQSHVLPKPLLRCTASDLLNAIANWDGQWGTSCAIQTAAIDVKFTYPNFRATNCLMPGSRIFFLGYMDASVRYFDLDECERSLEYTPKVLLPPKFPLEPTLAGYIYMHTAYDFSVQGAQSSSPHTRCIDHFNLGTVTIVIGERRRTLVQVWRIDVLRSELDSKITGLEVAKRLSSYEDQVVERLLAVSLYGDTIAYAVDHTARRCPVISVVKWAQANGKRGQDEVNRRTIRNVGYSYLQVFVMPQGYVLVVGTDRQAPHRLSARLFCWADDCIGALACVPGDPPASSNQIPEVWSCTIPENGDTIAIQTPRIIKNEICILLSCTASLSLLKIPLDTGPSGIKLQYFAFGNVNPVQAHILRAVGYHRTISVNKLRRDSTTRPVTKFKVLCSEYSWDSALDGDDSPMLREVPCITSDTSMPVPGRIAFDPCTNSTVVVSLNKNSIMLLKIPRRLQ